MVRQVIVLSVATVIGAAVTVEAQPKGGTRFAEMDRNKDQVITREEWQGSDRSFQVHDWNGDRVLSGDEVRTGKSRKKAPDVQPDFDSPDREYRFDDWTERGFRSLDHNHDNRVTADEWHFDREGFRRADHNGNNAISRDEFLGDSGDDDDRDDRFEDLDTNADGRIVRAEWHGSAARFTALDRDRNLSLSRRELLGDNAPPELFSSVDTNRDRVVTADEWHWSTASFVQRDVNADGRLSQEEFGGSTTAPIASAAYGSGRERGLVEGKAAGREDRDRNQGWDLDGQRELEAADSGYQSQVGPRAEYQAGYRDGFRLAYRDGWDRK